MNRLACLTYLVAMVWLGAIPGMAEAAAKSSPSPVTNPTQVSEHYHQVLQRPPFQESEETDVNAHLKAVLSQWFLQLGEKFGRFKYANQMSKFASLLLSLLVFSAIVGVLYVSFLIFRRRSIQDEFASSDTPGQKAFRPPEFYENEIQEAIRERDWHSAWLATWRQFLSRLENRHLVEADRTRTNREYLAQLRAQTLPTSALALLVGMVDTYDQFIYGRRAIGEPEWTLFHQQVNEATLLLHLEEKSTGFTAKPAAP